MSAEGLPRPRKRFGQHFLEPQWAARLVEAIAPAPDDSFLEIGPGRGAISRQLAARARQVVAVEVDRDLARALSAQAIPHLTVVEGDFLRLDPAALALPVGSRVAGNLPYNISTPILFRLLALAGAAALRDATLMLQREVVDRLTASPGSKDYGPLTVSVALGASVSRLLTLPPGAFRPPPKVTSAVVRLEFLHPPRHADVSATLVPLVRGIFGMRRKMLGNAVRGVAEAAGWPAGALLEHAGLDPRRRPDTLSVDELAGLARELARPAPQPPGPPANS